MFGDKDKRAACTRQTTDAKVAAGFRPAMPEFGNSITDDDLAAIMAYVRTLPAQQAADKAH